MAAKYIEVSQSLRTDILEGRYPPGSLLPTEQQLCADFQISRQTARQALQLLVDQGLIQRRQGSGSRVIAHNSAATQRKVAVIATYISDYIFPSILREMEAVLFANNCTMQLAATSNQISSERRILLGLLDQQVDGILVEGTKTALPNPNLDLYRKLQARGIPLVFFNGCYPDLHDCITILDDNFEGGRQLVRYLAAKGHTSIAGIFKSDDMQGHQRYAGFSAGLLECGLSMEDSHMFWYNTEDKPNLGTAAELWTNRVMDTIRGCTAVVCYNDEVANVLVQQLLRQRIDIPKELAIVSFDNSHYSDLSSCRITSLSHGHHNLGRISAEALLQAFHGKKPASQIIPWKIMEKESG